jgi:signal transduction histidine kinase
VRYIVEQHGGNIAVESKEGNGATFLVWLPLHEEVVT